ncbi:MAG: thiamine-phosphate kinase [Cyclobacteriaceae bacterium]
MSEKKEESRTEIGEIGEFGLIDRIRTKFKASNASTIHGIGDDAAVFESSSHLSLLSSDMLVEGVHFDLSYMPLQHLGYKAVAVNVSDIAAMNGIPQQITVNLGLSNRFSVEAVETLYEGIKYACEDFGVDLVGGDTTASHSGLVISVSVTGTVTKDKIVYRNSAEVNDILCVTGDLGSAFMGLQILEREKEVFKTNPEMQPELDKYEYLVRRQLKPKARMDIIHELAELKIIPTSMIDVSDGLVSEAFHICQQCDLGVAIFEDKLPIDQETYNAAGEFQMDPTTCALNGGEDYELLFTIGQDLHDDLKNHPDITMIGYMNEADKGRNLVTKKENVVALQAQGWKHF